MAASSPETVAVIVVTYNAASTIDRCLSAMAAQTRPADRIIVVDNDSRDGCVDRLAERYPGVELLSLPENVGFAAANNRGAEAAGDVTWLALLNPDAFAEPDWLANLLAASRRHPAATMIASRILLDDHPTLLDGAGDALHLSGRPWRIDHGRKADDHGLDEVTVFSPCAAAGLYRREAFMNVNGFDEDFFCYMEDIDLGFRMRLDGGECVYTPEATVRHIGSVTTIRHSDFYLYHSHRNIVATYVKNMPGRLFWLHLPLHLAMNLFTLLLFGAKGRAIPVGRAKIDAIKRLPKLWRERRAIQNRRTVSVDHIRRALTGGLPRP